MKQVTGIMMNQLDIPGLKNNKDLSNGLNIRVSDGLEDWRIKLRIYLKTCRNYDINIIGVSQEENKWRGRNICRNNAEESITAISLTSWGVFKTFEKLQP